MYVFKLWLLIKLLHKNNAFKYIIITLKYTKKLSRVNINNAFNKTCK